MCTNSGSGKGASSPIVVSSSSPLRSVYKSRVRWSSSSSLTRPMAPWFVRKERCTSRHPFLHGFQFRFQCSYLCRRTAVEVVEYIHNTVCCCFPLYLTPLSRVSDTTVGSHVSDAEFSCIIKQPLNHTLYIHSDVDDALYILFRGWIKTSPVHDNFLSQSSLAIQCRLGLLCFLKHTSTIVDPIADIGLYIKH